MNNQLREYLESIGLQRNATDKAAWAYYKGLEGDQRDKAKSLRRGQQTPTGDGSEGDEGDGDGSGAGQRSATPTTPTGTVQPNVDAARAAVEQERQRVSQIRGLFDGEHQDLMQRAIDEGWSEERASSELLSAIRAARANPVGGGAPFGHVRGDNTSREALQGALMLRSGVALDNRAFTTNEARALGLPSWIRADINSEERQRAMEAAHQFSGMSMVDICRASLQLAGRPIPLNQDEAIRASIEFGTLEPIFTTNVNSRLLVSYMEAMDTTRAWTNETEFGDFKENDLTTMGKMGALTKHGRGKTADLMDRAAETEPMKIARYTGMFQLDEIDIINNRLGNPTQDSPEEMGRSAAQLRPDLVYAILLANANLVKDGVALFAAAANNDFTGAGSVLGISSIEAGITAMMDQRERGRPLNIRAAYLLCAPTKKFEADRHLRSKMVADYANAGQLLGTDNVLSESGVVAIADSRLGDAGVVDPDTETAIAGNDDQWFLVANPREGGNKTITVGYRAGTGRVPQIRPYRLDRGQWGIGWDIAHDIGAKAIDHACMQRNASDQ